MDLTHLTNYDMSHAKTISFTDLAARGGVTTEASTIHAPATAASTKTTLRQLTTQHLAHTFGQLNVSAKGKRTRHTRKMEEMGAGRDDMTVSEQIELKVAEMYRVVTDLQQANKKLHRRVQQLESALQKQESSKGKLHERIQRLEANNKKKTKNTKK